MARRSVVATVAALLASAVTMGAAFGGGTCEAAATPPPPRCDNFDCHDPLFTVSHPPHSTYVSSHCVELAIPFAIYDGQVALLPGSADLGALEAITAGHGYHPVVTVGGRGIALLMISDFADTNAGPYREVLVAFAVNEAKVAVPATNPYTYLAEMFNPQHRIWMHKLILSEQMPIDWGREVVGYDKTPAPQRIDIDITADRTTFAAAEPEGTSILSGHVSVDRSLAAQAEQLRLVSSAGGGWMQPFLRQGGLVQANIVNPDVLGRSDELLRSYGLARVKSPPTLGPFDQDSILTADPQSDFGAALTRLDVRPAVVIRFAVRLIVDRGRAPDGALGSAAVD